MSGPIRGLHDVEGQLFAVSGRTLYQISNAGVAIPRGTIPGVGRVSMAHNQRSTGNELIVVNGSGGYVWNTGTQTFSVVTDAGYPGASVVDFIDGYLMQVEPFGRFLFHSDLADALEYNTLDRFEAETAPDRTLGMIVNHQEVWAFGERTIDVFGNAGTAQGTFQNKGVSISRGCAAKWTPAVIDNGVAWLGDDLKVYHANGYSPVRVSTRAVEVALSDCSRTDLRNAFSFVWEDLSHAVYYLTVPNGPTFGYDFSTGLWHRRASWHPEHDLSGRWRVNDIVKHNGEWIAGDYQTGKLYKLDWDYMLEGCEPLVRERVSPVAHAEGRSFITESVEVMFDTGGPATECQPWPEQPTGPEISGDAPNGESGATYSFTYTTAPGDNPIARTVITEYTMTVDGVESTLEAEGWSWDEATATISASPAIGEIVLNLTLRVYDVAGLWSEHQDSIGIGIPAWLGIRVSDPRVRTLFSTMTWGGSGDISLGVSNLADARAGIRYGEMMLVEIQTPGLSVYHLRGSPYTDLVNWGFVRDLPVSGQTSRLAVSGDRIFNFAGSSTSIYYLNDIEDADWEEVAFTGGFTNNVIYQLAGDGENVVAVNGYGTVWGSTDNGETFTKGVELWSPGSFNTMECQMDYGNGRFIIGGRKSSQPGGAYYTDDVGATAVPCAFPDGSRNQQPSQIKYCGNGRWLISFINETGATDSGLYLSSDNGATFYPVDLPFPMAFTQQRGLSIAVDSRRGVVVAMGIRISDQVRHAFYSDGDLTEWRPVSMSGTVVGAISELYPIRYSEEA